MHVQATGASSRRVGSASTARTPSSGQGRRDGALGGARQGQQHQPGDDEGDDVDHQGRAHAEGQRHGRSPDDADHLGDLVDGSAQGEHRAAQLLRHRLAQQRRLDAEERRAAGTEQGRGEQRHREVGEQGGQGAMSPGSAQRQPGEGEATRDAVQQGAAPGRRRDLAGGRWPRRPRPRRAPIRCARKASSTSAVIPMKSPSSLMLCDASSRTPTGDRSALPYRLTCRPGRPRRGTGRSARRGATRSHRCPACSSVPGSPAW